MNILVTGAGGYIGRHLVPKLRADGHEVRELHRAKQSDSARWDWVGGNLDGRLFTNLAECSGATMLEDISEPIPDTVIHLAGRVDIALRPNPIDNCFPPVPGEQDIAALYRDNVLATANVLDYCLKAGVKHLIFASSRTVYGDRGADEGIASPLEHYAASKRSAEIMLETTAWSGDLMVSILRLPGVYGDDRKSGAVWQMCESALRQKVVLVRAGFPLMWNCLHIEDVVAALVAATQRRDDSWIYADVADEGPQSLVLIAEEIAALTGAGVRIEAPPQPLLEPDYNLGWRRLNWKPKPRRERLAQVLEEVRQSLS